MRLVFFDNSIPFDIDDPRSQLLLNNACWRYLGQYNPDLCRHLSLRRAPDQSSFYLEYQEIPSWEHSRAFLLFDDISVVPHLPISFYNIDLPVENPQNREIPTRFFVFCILVGLLAYIEYGYR